MIKSSGKSFLSPDSLGVKYLTKIITNRLSGPDGDGDTSNKSKSAESTEGSLQFLNERNKRLAVLAMDPLTPFSGTSIVAGRALK